MIKSKTYKGVYGLNYIQDSELAFAIIYVVKREGIQYDKYVTGSSNRTYVHGESIGKVLFPLVFNAGDENVFVLFKVGSGVEPEVPPGVCVPVTMSAPTLPDGITGQAYSYTVTLSGTAPFVFTAIATPDGLTLTQSGNTVLLSGTPTAEGPQNVQFSVTNCSGGGSVSFDEDLTVTSGASPLRAYNNTTAFVFINSIGGITYTIQSGSIPIGAGQNMIATHPSYNGIIGVGISGVTFAYTLKLYRDGVLLETLSVTAAGGYIFAPQLYGFDQTIEIILG